MAIAGAGLLNLQASEPGDTIQASPRTFFRRVTFWDQLELTETYNPMGLGCSAPSNVVSIKPAPIQLPAGTELGFWDKGWCYATAILTADLEAGAEEMAIDGCDRLFHSSRAPVSQISLAGATLTAALIRQVVTIDPLGRKAIAESSTPLLAGASILGDEIVIGFAPEALAPLSLTAGHWRVALSIDLPGRGLVSVAVGQTESLTDGPLSVLGLVTAFEAIAAEAVHVMGRLNQLGAAVISFEVAAEHLLPAIAQIGGGASLFVSASGGALILGQVQQSASVSLAGNLQASGAATLGQIQQSGDALRITQASGSQVLTGIAQSGQGILTTGATASESLPSLQQSGSVSAGGLLPVVVAPALFA